MDLYDGEIAFTDLQVGRVLDALDASGHADDTVVVLFSDHGEELGDHGSTRHGHTLFGELVRVPLIVRAPGFAPRRVAGDVGLVDLAPTVLELVGLAPPPAAAGRSLAPAMRGEALPDAVTLLELERADMSLWGLVDGPWKLVRGSEPQGETLYHLGDDPREAEDRLAREPDVRERLAARLEQELEQARVRGAEFGVAAERDLLPGERERIRNLGYAGDR